MTNKNNIDGVINVYKEIGYTSHDVVAILRKTLGIKKIGHTGTLDPNVSGVLPICVGNSTKISSYLMNHQKSYLGELTFGYETDTEDIWGSITETCDYTPYIDELEKAISRINGKEILQTPPMYSAIKVGGKKLYELAREGKEIERKKRNAHIYSIELIRYINGKAHIKVTCSKGTYIRTLFKDLARECNSLGTMSSLIRLSSGGFNIKDSVTLSEIEEFSKNGITDFYVRADKALEDMERVNIPDFLFDKVINGVAIKTNLLGLKLQEDKEYLVYCREEFIGIYYHLDNLLKVKSYLYKR